MRNTEFILIRIVILWIYFHFICKSKDSLCGLVVRVPGYRSRCPGSIPGGTRFSEK
jgi:hypothetical protein